MDQHDYSLRTSHTSYGPPTPTTSPSYLRIKNSGAIPVGTVASRILFLQGLSNKVSSNTLKDTQNKGHESSSSRFGRGVSNNFSRPAQRLAKPHEEFQPEIAYSLGCKTPRIKIFDKNHILDTKTEKDTSYIRQKESLTPNQQLECDEASWKQPLRVGPKNLRVEHKAAHAEALSKKIDIGNSQNFSRVSVPITSVDPFSGNLNDIRFDRDDKSLKRYSDNSTETTSTLRRQSVRDLFDEHGVNRPSGLASSIGPRAVNDGVIHEPYISCHLCSRINKNAPGSCWQCRHHLCDLCGRDQKQDFSKESIKNSECLSPDYEKRSFLDIDSESFIRKSQRSRPTLIQSNLIPKNREIEIKPNKNLTLEQSLRETQLEDTNSINRYKGVTGVKSSPFLIGRDVTTSVKESPFLALDTSGSRELYSAQCNTQRDLGLNLHGMKSTEKASNLNASKHESPTNSMFLSKRGKQICPHDKGLRNLAGELPESEAKSSATLHQTRGAHKVSSRVDPVIFTETISKPKQKIITPSSTPSIEFDRKPISKMTLQNPQEEDALRKPKRLDSFHTEKAGHPQIEPVSGLTGMDATTSSQIQVSNKNSLGEIGKKKQRRLTISKKIKQSLSHNIDPKNNFETRAIDSNVGHTSVPDAARPSVEQWIDLPPIIPVDQRSMWKRNSGGSLADIASLEIRGVTVTLQLKGGEDFMFRAGPWDGKNER